MSRPISPETLKILTTDPFYKKCCISGKKPVQFHHNFIFGGQQCDEWWSILPLFVDIHAKADDKDIKDRLDWIMLNRASESELERFSKAVNLIAKRNYLNEKFKREGNPS